MSDLSHAHRQKCNGLRQDQCMSENIRKGTGRMSDTVATTNSLTTPDPVTRGRDGRLARRGQIRHTLVLIRSRRAFAESAAPALNSRYLATDRRNRQENVSGNKAAPVCQ